MMVRRKNKSLRSELATCTAKICAYMEVGKVCEARQWASILESKLKELGLLVDNPNPTSHNNPST